MTSRVTRSIVNPPLTKAKEKSPESSQIKKGTIVKKPRKEPIIYQVEALLDKKKMNGVWRYKVKWQGYPEDECTWEPAKNLENVKSMIKEFNETWEEPEGSDDEESEESEEKKTEKKVKSTKTKEPKQPKEPKEKKVKDSTDKEARRKKKSEEAKSPNKKIKTEKDQAVNGITEFGSLAHGDKIKKLLVAKSENSSIIFTVEWEQRKDGTIPKRSTISNTELRKNNKDLLLDYYEERLKFIKPSHSKSSLDKSSNPVPEEIKKPTVMEEEKEKGTPAFSAITDNKGVEIEDEANKNKELEPKILSEQSKRDESNKENMDVSNLIQNDGQTIFADLGSNSVQEIRDLTLDANMRIFNQAENSQVADKKDTANDPEDLKKDVIPDIPKNIDGQNNENAEFAGLDE